MQSSVEDEKAQKLAALRVEIDRIDAEVVELIGQRARIVEQVGRLKPSVEKVRVPEREKQVLDRVSQMAAERGVDPAFIEQLYQLMFNYFVDHQQEHIRQRADEE